MVDALCLMQGALSNPPAAEALAGGGCVCQAQFVDWLVLEAGRGSRRGPSVGFYGELVLKQLEANRRASLAVLRGFSLVPPGLLTFNLDLTQIVSMVSKLATFETICRNCQPECKSIHGSS